MAAQTLTVPNSTATPSVSATGKTALDEHGPRSYFDVQNKTSSKDIEEAAKLIKDVTLNSKIRAIHKDPVKRGHAYVNLPMHLPISAKARSIPQVAVPGDSKQPQNRAPSVGKMTEQSIPLEHATANNKVDDPENEDEKTDKFCWSPRCPPDGAAVYDTSPTNSSVSSSPITKSLPDPPLLSHADGSGATKKSTNQNYPKLDSNLLSSKLLEGRKPINLSLPPLLSSSMGKSNDSCKTGIPNHQTNDRSHPAYSDPKSTDRNTPSPTLPLPPPPNQSPVPTEQVPSSPPYYHEHARADELLSSKAKGLTLVNSSTMSQPIPSFQLQQSASVSLPLPPPPLSQIAPVVPRRDPNTVLQNGVTHPSADQLMNLNSTDSPGQEVPTGSNVTIVSQIHQEHAPNTTSAEAKQTRQDVIESINQSSEFTLQNQHSAPVTSVKITDKHVITRPVPVKSSPETETPVGCPRRKSQPNNSPTTNTTDGRTVVPWDPKDPSLQTPLATSSYTLQEAVTAALLSQSKILPDATPQWIPPEPSVGRQRTMTTSTNKKVDFVGSDSKELDCQHPTNLTIRESQSKRPNCLPILENHAASEISRHRTQRGQTGHISSRSDGIERRHHTTSDFEALRLVAEQTGYLTNETKPYRVPFHSSKTDNFAIFAPNVSSMSVAEAEWLRAQQRSKRMIHTDGRRMVRSTKVTPEKLYFRQVSAEPGMALSPTDPQLISASEMLALHSDSLPADFSRTRILSASTHGMPQSLHERQFFEEEQEELGLRNKDVPEYDTRFQYPREYSMQYIKDSRQFPTDVDLHRSKSIPTKHQGHIRHQISDDFHYRTDMTQSVLAPPISGWQAVTPTSSDGRHASSSSGRRRRSKHGILRSQSQRTVDQFKPAQLLDGTPMNEIENGNTNFYQRSLSQNVPAEDAPGFWPPLFVQWHHRRPVLYAPDMIDAQPEQYWHARKDDAESERSSSDLFRHRGGKRIAPLHHNSASAIFDRLDLQPWFHFDLPRAAAERILKKKRVGSFLVRQSETCKSEYSLSIRRECDVLHMKISVHPETGYYVLGEYSQPYPSISAMIYRYTRSLLPVRGSTPILLQFPVERTDLRQSQPKS